jgi:hypothetical protein
MHFGTKNYLKNNRNHTVKLVLKTHPLFLIKKNNSGLKSIRLGALC